MSYKLMIVDDEPANLRLLERLLRREHQVVAASSGAEALRLLEQHDVALLITDQRMPGMTGIELLTHSARLRPHMVRIILTGYTDVGDLVEAINCGQVYKYITKPWDNDALRLTVNRALQHYEASKVRHELALANQRLSARLGEMTRGFVRTIADALEAKDEYVHGHARRVSGYAVCTGRRLGMGGADLEQLALAAILHDIGKIGTPDRILLEPRPLTDDERAVMQLHPERGARMLAGLPDLHDVMAVVRHHHEHYDGTGYPEGLRREQIPLAARVIHLTDAYDAMTSPRPFREAWTHEEALDQLLRGAGTQFDPRVVRAFAEIETIAHIRRSIASDATYALLPQPSLATVLNADSLSLAELRRLIETEPTLAACVLRLANEGPGQAATARLGVACARLGVERVREIVAGKGGACRPGDDQQRAHAMRCAAAARLLAQRTAFIEPDDAYTLGLLHDAGEMLLHTLYPEDMDALAGLYGETRAEREVAAFGVDHAQVSQWVLESCGLPLSLTAPVLAHHDMMRINDPAALLLHLADAIASADEPYKVATLDELGSDRLAMLGLSRADLAEVHAGTASEGEARLAFTY